MRRVYKRISDAEIWQSNKYARFVRPYIRIFVRIILVKPLNIVARLKKRGKNSVQRVNPETIKIERARKALNNRQWDLGLKLYTELIEMDAKRPIKLENKNEARMQISLIERILNLDAYKKQISIYKKAVKKTPPKIVVFTAIAGGYDTLKLPEELNPAFDYILFTDTPVKDSGIFKVRPMPYFHEDTTRQARFVKTHPHQLLPGYDYAIWIDANIMIMDNIEPLFKKFKDSKKPIGAIRHPLRSSIYEETRECIKRSKEDANKIIEQENHYKELGFDCTDLIESNIMMIDLNNPKIQGLYATWWAEIDTYTRRDQLSLNYALVKNKVSWFRIMDRPENARNHPYFSLAPHHIKQIPLLELQDLLAQDTINPAVGPSFYKNRDIVVGNKRIKDLSVDIIYCVHNALEDVKICLDSVVKHHANNERLIIIDDGSGDETKTFLEEFSKVNKKWTKLIRSESGSGYTKAANRGLKASTADFVILLNSDTIVTRDWTAKMAHAVLYTPGAGIVGPLSSAASHQSIPNHVSSSGQTATNELPHGLSPDDLNNYCENWSVANQYIRVPLVHGFCFGITRETIKKLGYFDEKNFEKGYGEENDYCFRAVNAGIGLVIATNTYIFHAKSKSYIGPERIELMKHGNETLAKLYGKERIRRAILSVQKNPTLIKIRNKTSKLYERVEDSYRKEKAQLKKILKKYYGYTEASNPRPSDKIKIDLILQNGETKPTSSAFIRLISPLTDPSVKDKISLRIYESNKYEPAKNTNICIVQRTAVNTLSAATRLIDSLKKSDIKLVIDTDDAFTEIEEAHPEYFTQKEKVEALQYLIKHSDQLWVSTNIIADQYKNKARKVYVIPNRIDERIWKINTNSQRKSERNRKLQLVYMGTSTHAQDLQLVLPYLDKLHEKYPNSFELTLIGVDKNPESRSWIKNITADIPSILYPEFISWFQKQGPFDVGLAPLVDTPFNRAKSDIKLLDYLAAGVLPMASALSPYTNSEAGNFAILVENDISSWHNNIQKIIKDQNNLGLALYNDKLVNGQLYIQEKRRVNKTSDTLLQVITNLKD